MERPALMDVSHPLHEASEGDVRAAVHRRLGEGADAWAALAVALREPTLEGEVQAAGTALVQALVAGGTLLVAGNGGSAAIASHVAAEFIGKCIHDREPLPAVNLAESLSSVTAVGNDYGFDQIFRRGVAALGRRGDVLLAMSTSGTSPNVLQALLLARERGLLTVALTGAKGEGLRGAADHVLVVPSADTPRIQEVHMLWTHAWCEAVDVLANPESAH
ncbi:MULTISPECIES: D-sedoheptulose-7-phosphate isomerase [Allobranchiibius]|uniref:D-sedoheptulose 7-phosphate isomerase n=1 Tax=Allobranchiibius huperziae TaxID=1874116 RepID=A0A853DJ48_9MICO|nr:MULTISPECIES: SIS domain-containing protein [Allobranchiibius]MBO1766580.1 SIS domain-containing protein [Allobranchiibius sp. GilTou38]NYJ74801.1 D-sedoheptulose 7-phosphate isomerase [Allobranchiibius huperziae]